MKIQQAAKLAALTLSQLADPEIISLAEGRLALAVLIQAFEDMLYRRPGGRLYITHDANRPCSWNWWCKFLRIDAEVARAEMLRYDARYKTTRRLQHDG